jgi:Fe-coproporphyrin III synthase
MFTKLRYIASSLTYAATALLTRQRRPFIAGLVLNNHCNLQCAHCHLDSADHSSLSYDQLSTALDSLRALGIRSLAITGGEPFLWTDGTRRLHDVVNLIYHKGFHVTSVYTNGTLPLAINTDNVFVSVDGTEETTRKLRGPVFSTVMRNIAQSRHPKIFVNFTINRTNMHEIAEFCASCRLQPNIKGIFFYFHTPYYGIDNLFIPRQDALPIVRQILALKKRYPILNSSAALHDYLANNWPRPSDVCVVYSNTAEIVPCCRAVTNKEACQNCGYLGYLEVIDITRYKLSALWEALAYLPSARARRSCDC